MEKTNEIKKLEEMGFDVIAMSNDGTLIILSKKGTDVAKSAANKCQYCDECRNLMFVPDPDPDDWFRDDDQKAVCMAAKKKIIGSLQFNELKNIRTPSFCPKK